MLLRQLTVSCDKVVLDLMVRLYKLLVPKEHPYKAMIPYGFDPPIYNSTWCVAPKVFLLNYFRDYTPQHLSLVFKLGLQ